MGMLFETRLRRLEARYRARLMAAGAQVADAARAGEPSAMVSAIERANAQWKALEHRLRSTVPSGHPAGELEEPATA